MRNRASKRILSFALAAALLLGVCVTNGPMTTTAYAALPTSTAGQPYDGVDFNALTDNGIYYGIYDHATSLANGDYGTATKEGTDRPILWRVMGEENGNGKLTLLSEYVLDTQQFHGTWNAGDNYYNDSDIRAWLNNTFLDSFSTEEEGEIAHTDVVTGMYLYNTGVEQTGSYTSTFDNHTYANNLPWTAQNDKVYLPWGKYNDNSVYWTAGNDIGEGKLSSNTSGNIATLKDGITNVYLWLRSPDSVDSLYALCVNTDGDVDGNDVGGSLGVRPAFQFNPSSVIFSSEIADVAVEANGETQKDDVNYFTGVAGRANFKLTIVNDGLTLSNLDDGNGTLDGDGSQTLTVAPGGTIALTGSIGGGAEKLAYKIVDRNSGEIVGYGAGTDTTNLTVNGTANVTGSGALSTTGSYTLYVWAQEDNDKNSHEGSEPMYFTLEVEDATPGPGLPTASPGDLYDGIDFDALIGEGIYYGTYDHATSLNYGDATSNAYEGEARPILWRVMGEENDEGYLTLMSEYVLDGKQFHASSNDWDNSGIKSWLNGDFLNSFRSTESDIIVAPSTLNTKSMPAKTIANVTPSKIWLPTTNDWDYNSGYGDVTWYSNLNNTPEVSLGDYTENIASLKNKTNVYYWLRSPDSGYSRDALCVLPGGGVSGGNVGNSFGVRPAFQFNPSSVIFSSEIADGAVEANGETQSNSDYSSIAAGGGAQNYKLTVVNSGLTLGSLDDGNGALDGNGSETLTVTPGGSLALTGDVNGATKMAYKIVDRSSGEIVGYGIGDDTTLTVNGIANMTTGGGALSTTGSYTLYVWAQEDNAINSHEGSEPMYFTLEVQAQDTAAPTVTAYSPLYGADNVSTGASLTLTFTKNITAVSGKYITIHNDTDGGSEQIEATDAQVTVANNIVTITPTGGLESGKSYHVTIDAGAFKDSADNDYAGISDAVTWAFSTADAAQGASLSLDYMADDTATEGEPYYKTIPVTYTNGTGTLGYSISGEPSGLTVVSLGSSGAITGTPTSGTEAGSPYTITVTVTDGMGASDSRSYTLMVEAAPGSGATLDIATPTDLMVTEGEYFTKTLSVTYTGSGTLEYDINGLPDGVTYNTSTGEISGAADSGTADNSPYSVTVDVTDNGGLDTGDSFTLTVLPGQQPPQPPVTYYTVTYSAGTGGSVSSGHVSGNQVTSGSAITITASANRDYRFTGWTVNGASGGSNNPGTFTIMQDTDIVANFTYTGGNNDSGGSSSGDSGSSYTPTWNVTTDKQPNLPKTATLTYSGTVVNGRLTFTVTKAMVQAAIDKAGTDPDGIALIFKISNTSGYTCQTVVIEESALDLLKSSGVKYAQADSALFKFRFDSKAINQLDSQTTGAVSVNANPAKLNEAAQKLIGSRPAFDITVQFKKSGTTYNVNDLGSGSMTRWIAYKPASGENTGNLAAVYVDKNGVPSWIEDSVYDNGWVSWTSGKLSVYGVGYKTSAPDFTDTANHWAKDYIDFAVSRGLISGTGTATFSPDAAMTRAVFLSALGKLSGADVSGYTTSSFTDVSNTDPAMPYIEWAVKNGIVQGVGDNKFAPDFTITREQMAVMMVNYAKALNYTLPVAVEAYKFIDADKISAYAKDAVTAVQQAGIIVGKGGGVFDPQGKATRAEGSTILQRFVELVIDPASARGWVQNDSGGWMYYGLSTGKLFTGWQDISGKRYYFDKNGVMQAEKWLQIDSKWYYFQTDGSLAVDTKIDGYEVGADGARK